MKPRHLNVSADHLSHIETGEEPTNIDNGFLDAQMFRVDIIDDHYGPIIKFLANRVAPKEMTTS